MLDIVEALDLLDSCGPRSAIAHVTAERDCAAGALTVCALSPHVDDIVAGFLRDAVRSRRPGCANAAADRTPLASGGAPALRWRRETLSVGAVIVLCAAESARRRGATWHQYVQVAEQAAVRYLDVLPESSFPSSETPSTAPGSTRPQVSTRQVDPVGISSGSAPGARDARPQRAAAGRRSDRCRTGCRRWWP